VSPSLPEPNPGESNQGPLAFSPAVRTWFESGFAAATPPQRAGWPVIASGDHTLIVAPTGSGKTLAAFLWAIDRLGAEPTPPKLERCRVLYISPLRALAVDIEKNLRAPLTGIRLAAERIGVEFNEPTVAIRTGDTETRERAAMLRSPPDILITTPESLYLMLTSRARETLRSVRWVIVDEIHALAPTKRGAHLSLSLERLSEITAIPPQRIGLSATVRPLDEMAAFLGGYEPGSSGGRVPRRVTIVDSGARKPLDLEVIVPVDDLADVGRARDELDTTGDAPEARTSIWPHIHPRLLELIRAHRTTLVFVNARRLAERLAARLNELAGEELVRAHHGSLAREQRTLVEDELKAGRLRAIVATSSLELGIDMGTVDLVVLVESPGSVARGLQRVGRAGHQVDAPSTGRIFPKWRGDLVEATAVVQRMRAGLVEEMRTPRNPLDVLAQQIVAMTSMEEWRIDDLCAVVRRSANFVDLTDDVMIGVLDMLAGRYPSDRFSQLRPRVVWDRVNETVRAREGSQRLAVTSGGTIPDRGLFGVFTPEGSRVGELDEEMVYESRPGEVFVLGASAWRIEEITSDRVVVTPAPGQPGKLPFWRGDGLGRPLELGRAIGALVRTLRAQPRNAAEAMLSEIGLDDRAVSNLLQYLDDQAVATGAVPDDVTIVLERFPDEIGDWRLCLLTPFGARVHAPWALAIEEKLARLELSVTAMWTDDGIVLRLPEAIDDLPLDALAISAEEIEELVVARLPSTSLFAARFRENSARALLLPRQGAPGKRTPLWQQRRRAADLLEVAADFPEFPMLLETTRECLREVFDLPSLREVLGGISARSIRVVPVETRSASPFAQSLLFAYVATYLYEGDAPLAERRSAALSLDRDLLRELLGSEELRELLDPAVVEQLELELQRLVDDRRATSIDSVHDLLRDLGDLTTEEVEARSTAAAAAWIRELIEARRVIEIRIAGDIRFVIAEDAGKLRDGLGIAIPAGLPVAFTDPIPNPLDEIVGRFARTHGPFTTHECAARFATTPERIQQSLARLASVERVVEGEFRPAGHGREWCDAKVLAQLRRRSLAAARREIEPVEVEAYARFLTQWHGIGRSNRGMDALVESLELLQGAAIPVSVLEREILPARVSGYSSGLLDELCAAGELVWVGAGALGADDGRIRLYFRDRFARLRDDIGATESLHGPLHAAIRSHLAQHGASFWPDLLGAAANPSEPELLAALFDLVWAGEVTNDTFAPLRAVRTVRRQRNSSSSRSRRPAVGRLSRLGPPAAAGRWSLVANLVHAPVSSTERAHARAEQLLARHGIITREGVRAEGTAGGFAGVYPLLRAMEESGRVRRGWFIDGLGAAQFGSAGAIEGLRTRREASPEPTGVVLAATDPANPYGAALSWPDTAGRPTRASGALVVLVDGHLAAFLDRGGRSLLTFVAPSDHTTAAPGTRSQPRIEAELWIEAIVAAHKDGRVPNLEIRLIDGEPARTSPHAAALMATGFAAGYRGLTLR
jgi:ATP-dependent Lhr-like helicase